MSEITKPIALDESLHTTEQTPRNLADVLSDELQNLATAISGGSDKVPKTDIATVEPTNTASRAYSVGELVYVNGNLYKVITAIASGATFTVGTNIQSTNVSDAIDDISAENVSYGNGTVEDALDELSGFTTLTGNPTYFGSSNLNKLYYSKIGKIVVGSGRIITTVDKPSGQANYLFNNLPIPIGFTSPVLNNSGNNNIIINGDGQLTSNLAITAGAYNLSFCYIAND